MNVLILGSLFWCIYNFLFFYITSAGCAKKANYDCSKCKDWHCNSHWCQKKRNITYIDDKERKKK